MDLSAIGFVETSTPAHILILRVIIAALLGGIIGIEREAHRMEAGLRTHMLIAMAAALFTMLAFEIFHLALGDGSMNPDPIRAVEAVTAGIAFLGAGAIFRHGDSVHGLTTGVGMWLAGAIGISVALGHYLIAAATTLIALVVLALLRVIAHKVLRRRSDDEPVAPAPGPDRGT